MRQLTEIGRLGGRCSSLKGSKGSNSYNNNGLTAHERKRRKDNEWANRHSSRPKESK